MYIRKWAQFLYRYLNKGDYMRFIDRINVFTNLTKQKTDVIIQKRHNMINWLRHKYLPMLLFFITFGIYKPNKRRR